MSTLFFTVQYCLSPRALVLLNSYLFVSARLYYDNEEFVNSNKRCNTDCVDMSAQLCLAKRDRQFSQFVRGFVLLGQMNDLALLFHIQVLQRDASDMTDFSRHRCDFSFLLGLTLNPLRP